MKHAGKWTLAAVAACCVASSVVYRASSAAEPADEKDVSVQMQAKLASAEKVLKGLVTEDFDLIRSGAEELRDIGALTDRHAKDDQVYDHYSAEFRRQAEKLILMAERKNLEGASFCYMHTTSVCISCHQHVRDVGEVAPLHKVDRHVKPAVGSR